MIGNNELPIIENQMDDIHRKMKSSIRNGNLCVHRLKDMRLYRNLFIEAVRLQNKQAKFIYE
jgi:hypothetical protein